MSDTYLLSLHIVCIIFAFGGLVLSVHYISILYRNRKNLWTFPNCINLAIFIISCLALSINYFLWGDINNTDTETSNILFIIQSILGSSFIFPVSIYILSFAIQLLIKFSESSFLQNNSYVYNFSFFILSLGGIIVLIIFQIHYGFIINESGYCIPKNSEFVDVYQIVNISIQGISIALLLFLFIKSFKCCQKEPINRSRNYSTTKQEYERDTLKAYNEFTIKLLPSQVFSCTLLFLLYLIDEIMGKDKLSTTPRKVINFILQLGYSCVGGLFIFCFGYRIAKIAVTDSVNLRIESDEFSSGIRDLKGDSNDRDEFSGKPKEESKKEESKKEESKKITLDGLVPEDEQRERKDTFSSKASNNPSMNEGFIENHIY
ncbi:MAG: hypothetical protein MJ252_17770 [archaeon]|nr:hypothetical protein [archaeon]